MSYEELPPDRRTVTTPESTRGRLKHNSLPKSQMGSETPTKKPHVKPRTHARTPLQAKLGKTQSNTSATTHMNRPGLNRSKSSEGHLKPRPGGALKRNRSLIKSSGLFPLTKTTSNQSLKSNKSTASLKGLAGGHGSNAMVPFSGLKNSIKKEKEIMRMNADSRGDDYEDMVDEPDAQTDTLEPQRFNIAHLTSRIDQTHDGNMEDIQAKNHLNKSSAASSSHDLTLSNNMYSGSLLLSQSTGLVRNISERPATNKSPVPNGILSFQATGNRETTDNSNDNSNAHEHSVHPPIHSNNILHQLGVRVNQVTRPKADKTAFSDYLNSEISKGADHSHDTRTQQRLWLQRENSLMDAPNLDQSKFDMSNLSLNQMMFSHAYSSTSLANIKVANSASMAAGNTEHAHDMNKSPVKAHRTPLSGLTITTDDFLQQQLQSAHIGHPADTSKSMLNVTWFMLGAQSHQSSIQLRTEFERMNREYLNVRRYRNPVNESLNRTSRYFQASRGIEVTKRLKNAAEPLAQSSKSGTTFKAVSELYHNDLSEVDEALNRFWQDALSDLLSLGNTTPRENSQQGAHGMHGQIQSGHIQRHNSEYSGPAPNRAHPTPATRAVKLASRAAVHSSL